MAQGVTKWMVEIILLIIITIPSFWGHMHITTSTVPECFSDHILVSDAVVGQGLAPHGVEGVVQGLGSKFIGLKDKYKDFSAQNEPER